MPGRQSTHIGTSAAPRPCTHIAHAAAPGRRHQHLIPDKAPPRAAAPARRRRGPFCPLQKRLETRPTRPGFCATAQTTCPRPLGPVECRASPACAPLLPVAPAGRALGNLCPGIQPAGRSASACCPRPRALRATRRSARPGRSGTSRACTPRSGRGTRPQERSTSPSRARGSARASSARRRRCRRHLAAAGAP